MERRSDALIGKVRELYAATGDKADDLERFLTMDFVITEASDLSYGGCFRGPSALRSLVDRINAMIVAKNVVIERYAVGENHVVASLSFDVPMPDGTVARQWVAEEFFFRGGLIAEIRPYYFDTSIINRAVGIA